MPPARPQSPLSLIALSALEFLCPTYHLITDSTGVFASNVQIPDRSTDLIKIHFIPSSRIKNHPKTTLLLPDLLNMTFRKYHILPIYHIPPVHNPCPAPILASH